MSHKFYDIKKINMIELFKDAKNKAFEVRVDILDCTKSMARQKIDMSFNEVIRMYNNKCHTVFIHRKEHWREEYIETGFSTMNSPSYFLWINMNINHLDFFIKKYDLTEL